MALKAKFNLGTKLSSLTTAMRQYRDTLQGDSATSWGLMKASVGMGKNIAALERHLGVKGWNGEPVTAMKTIWEHLPAETRNSMTGQEFKKQLDWMDKFLGNPEVKKTMGRLNPFGRFKKLKQLARGI